MDNFIEITGIDHTRLLVNVNNILWITEKTDAQLGEYTNIQLVTGSVCSNESYEKIRELIRNLGKTFIVHR